MRLIPVITAALFVVACERSSSPTGGPPPTPEPSATAARSGATDIGAAPDAPVASARPAVPAGDAGPAGVLPALAVPESGKDKAGGTAGAGAGADAGAAATALKPVSKHIEGNHFALDLASAGCKAGAECTMTIKLVATADYHVNKEYPYKFIAAATPGVDFLGKPDPTTFTRAAGDFLEQGEKTGTMTIRFKPSTPGTATIAGTYKFSVCSADQCQIEQEKLELPIATQ